MSDDLREKYDTLAVVFAVGAVWFTAATCWHAVKEGRRG